MAHILIAEDDKSLQLLLKSLLEGHYQVTLADNGQAALDVIENGLVDLLITDISMPIMDGQTLVRETRQLFPQMPIIMLTAKQAMADKKEGFENGADDYLTKPVDLEELELRVAALMRRANIATKRTIQINQTTLDETSYTVSNGQVTIELPKKEFQLLYKLMSYPNTIFTQSQLLDDIWGMDSFSSEDTIKTHISRVRKACKVFPDIKITTVRGLGYKGEIND